jgi:hypothetical protein
MSVCRFYEGVCRFYEKVWKLYGGGGYRFCEGFHAQAHTVLPYLHSD